MKAIRSRCAVRATAHLFLGWVITLMLALGLIGCGGGGGGASASTSATTITSQPTDQAVIEGNAASFSVVAEHAKSYQWQIGTGGTWVDISDAHLSHYLTGTATTSMSGQQYRVVVIGETNTVISSAASLTVTGLAHAPAISAAPSSVTVYAGQSANFVVTATGTDLSYQWQQSRDGATWTHVAGATLATLSLPAVLLTDNGLSLRVTVSNSKGSITSPVALLTVEPVPVPPTFSRSPTDLTVATGQPATFEAMALGTPTPTLRWQRSTDGGTTWLAIAGATAASYTTPALTAADDGQLLRAVASNSAGSVYSTAALLRVRPPAAPALLIQPQDLSLQMPATAEFRIQVSGTPTPTLQWQHSTDDGQTWANINGATSASYSLGEVGSADNGRRLRVVASNTVGSVTSRAALLSVSASTRLLAMAGRAAGPGHLDGPALDAMFERPEAVAISPSGTIFIADAGSHVVRKIASGSGIVSTLAGRPYEPGDNDGATGVARLRDPLKIAADAFGNVFLVEGTTRIRKIDSAGLASTVAYRPPPVFDEYVRGYDIGGIAADVEGNIYFTDRYVVRKLDRQGQLSILAGQDNNWGNVDGTGSAARFRALEHIRYQDGMLVVNDANTPRSVSLSGEVQTLSAAGYSVSDGFYRPVNAVGEQIATERLEGFIYTASAGHSAFISGEQVLGGTVIAGRPSLRSWRDGPATLPPVVGPTVAGITRDATGAVYITTGAAVRKVLTDGSISTLAGHVGISGTLDGIGTDARFKTPGDILASGSRLYVCDGPSVRVIDANRQVSTLATWPLGPAKDDEGFVGYCVALAQDSSGILYVATDDGSRIYKIDPASGNLANWPNTGSLDIRLASGIAVDPQGNVFVSDSRRHLIHRISAGGNSTVWAGQNVATGAYQDGSAASARFNSPSGLVMDGNGSLYVADTGNHVVRRIDAQGNVSTVLGLAGYATVVLGDDPRLKSPRRLAIWAQDQLLINATHQVLRAVVPGLACQCAPWVLRARSGIR